MRHTFRWSLAFVLLSLAALAASQPGPAGAQRRPPGCVRKIRRVSDQHHPCRGSQGAWSRGEEGTP